MDTSNWLSCDTATGFGDLFRKIEAMVDHESRVRLVRVHEEDFSGVIPTPLDSYGYAVRSPADRARMHERLPSMVPKANHFTIYSNTDQWLGMVIEVVAEVKADMGVLQASPA